MNEIELSWNSRRAAFGNSFTVCYAGLTPLLYHNGALRAALSELTRNRSVAPQQVCQPRMGYERRQWRSVAPNLVVHPFYGDAVAVATDGVHAFIEPQVGRCVEVAHNTVLGPLVPEVVEPEDWDWTRNTRKVRIFRRAEGKPPAVVPINTWLEDYWSRYAKLSHHELMVAAALGSCDTKLKRLAQEVEAERESYGLTPRGEVMYRALVRNTAARFVKLDASVAVAQQETETRSRETSELKRQILAGI